MARLRRRILWGFGLAALVVAGAALYVYFLGTLALLERAEAFAFRRMTVTRLAEESVYRFFYATNRVAKDPDGAVEGRFGSAREPTLKFGSFDTRIEPSLGLGILVDPSDWFLNEEIKLTRVQSRQPEAFVTELRKQVDASPYRSLLVVVHGFREAFPSALRKTAFLAHVLDIDTPVLLFDWPGNQGSSLRGYLRARQIARASGAELAAILELVVDEIEPDRLWLIANSMGGEVVVDAIGLLFRNPEFSDLRTEIEDVVLTAPDVGHAEFNREFKREIKAMAGNVTVYVSSNDRALLVSRLVNRSLRLGESTLDLRNPGQLEQASSFSELLDPGDDQLVLVDVTPVNRTRFFHNFSLETPEFFDDLFLRFIGSELPQTRELYFLQTPEGTRYFVLTRGR